MLEIKNFPEPFCIYQYFTPPFLTLTSQVIQYIELSFSGSNKSQQDGAITMFTTSLGTHRDLVSTYNSLNGTPTRTKFTRFSLMDLRM